MSYRHYIFLQQSLEELDQSLRLIGPKLIIKVGNAIEILNELHLKHRPPLSPLHHLDPIEEITGAGAQVLVTHLSAMGNYNNNVKK